MLNRGGLHNRVTRQIYLSAFTLTEASIYLRSRNIALDLFQLSQLYMTLGGIPYYLRLVSRGRSVSQIVDSLLFAKNAPLRHEFENLYQALFDDYEKYILIVKACYSKWKGLTHQEIVDLTKLPSGGSLTRKLKDLEKSGFITSYQPFGKKKKDTLLRLTDEFSIFYLKFVSDKRVTGWTSISQSQTFRSWLGFAFENLCHKHLFGIKKKLGISGVEANAFSFYVKGTESTGGTQIDLVIDRKDHVINICEIKYHDRPFIITKAYKNKLREKIEIFRATTQTSKTIHLTMITCKGVKENLHRNEIVDSEIVLSDLFEDGP